MELFSTVAKTLAECRQRDEWIAKKKRNNNDINKYIYENDRNNKIIGRRCKCIFTGLLVTGVIEAVEENEYSVQMKVHVLTRTNGVMNFILMTGLFGRKPDGFGSLKYLELLPDETSIRCNDSYFRRTHRHTGRHF